MQDTTTIKKIFDESDIQFAVPAYQRAYSWEVDSDRKQVKQFLLDLLEQIEFTRIAMDGKVHRKTYFLGHFLFETDKNNINKFWIIDGQQRLTTVVIFISAIINELELGRPNRGTPVVRFLTPALGSNAPAILKRFMRGHFAPGRALFDSVAGGHGFPCNILED